MVCIFMIIKMWFLCSSYHNNSHKMLSFCVEKTTIYYQGIVPRKRCNNLHTLSIDGDDEGRNLAYLCNP